MDVNSDNDYMTEDEEIPITYGLTPSEEQSLSQKLSQLSTSHRQTEPIDTVNEDLEDNIPSYLEKGSKPFEKIIEHVSSLDTIEEIRQMAIRMYQLYILNLQKSLWMTYLQAGTGKLKSNQRNDSIGPQIWPAEVQSMMKQSTNENGKDTCLDYVTRRLSDFDKKMNQYQIELNIKKNKLSNYIKTIETFVQQGLESIRLEIHNQIALVQYNYDDQVLDVEYNRYNPTHHQKQIAKQLCHAKYQQEITKEEFILLKQRISSQKSSPISEIIVEETFFNTIENQDVRRKLQHQYKNVVGQAKEEMIQLYLSTAEAQMDRYRQQFDAQMKQFWFEQRSLPDNQKLTAIMIHLLEQRWKNISECVKCAYKYRADLIHLNFMY